jgi:polyisoprenoid-binding protein YceI
MSIQRTRRVLAGLAVLVGVAFAPMHARGQAYRIDPEHSTAGFAVNHFGILRERGEFKRAAGTIVVDPDGRTGGSIGVVIDLASVDTGWDLRDDFLRGPTMFDVVRYPEIRFRSHHLEYRDHKVVAADGDITLHGVTRPLPVATNAMPSSPGGCCGGTSGSRLRIRWSATRWISISRSPPCASATTSKRTRSSPSALQRATSFFIRSTAATSSRVMPGSRTEWPASGTTTYSASGHARASVSAVTGGQTMS